MALLPLSESANPHLVASTNPLKEQPRQPTSLHGLMKFSLQASNTEDSLSKELGPMDQERKKFLEEALSSMTVDVVKVLQNEIKTLKDVETINEGEELKYLESLGIITDYVDDIDTANDFHKIGGFLVLYPCLKSEHSKIRAMACELIAVLCQNNPYCQRVVLDNEFVPFLINLINKEKDQQVITKVIYALGGIIRENDEGVKQFLQHEGIPTLFKCLDSSSDNVVIKTSFLLSSLCRMFPEVKSQFLRLGIIHKLLDLIMMERCKSQEHVLSFLLNMVQECPEAVVECHKYQNNAKEVLNKYKDGINNEEYYEEIDYCNIILNILG